MDHLFSVNIQNDLRAADDPQGGTAFLKEAVFIGTLISWSLEGLDLFKDADPVFTGDKGREIPVLLGPELFRRVSEDTDGFPVRIDKYDSLGRQLILDDAAENRLEEVVVPPGLPF